MNKLRVLFASFEASPFIKTGGLGDVAAALPGAVQYLVRQDRFHGPAFFLFPGRTVSAFRAFYIIILCRAPLHIGKSVVY